MKRTYLIITALFGTSCMLNAQQTTGVIADNLKIERNGEYESITSGCGKQ